MTREEAIKIIDCYDIGFYDLSGAKIPADKLADAFDMAIEALRREEVVVRCKDCIHYEKHDTWSACTYWSGDPYEQASVIDDDFCSYGERQEP